MKRFLPLLMLIVGVILGAAGMYVATHWNRVTPFRGNDLAETERESLLAQLRKACITEPSLKGASVRTIDVKDGAVTVNGWIANAEQKAALEEKAKGVLNESPELRGKFTSVGSSLTVFSISEHLMKLQHDFDEGKGAENEKDALKRSVMRMTRLDSAGFTTDGKLLFQGVCIRGSEKKATSAAALGNAIQARLVANGLATDVMPDLALNIQCFTNPAVLLQKQLARDEASKDVRITAAWFDGAGKLHIDGIVTKVEQKKLVDAALDTITNDKANAPIFGADAKLDVHLVTVDSAAVAAELQKKLIELARKENKTHLRRVKLAGVAPIVLTDTKNQPVADDEGNTSYCFRVTGRLIERTPAERVQIENDVATWLAAQMPSVNNPDQTLMPLHLELTPKANPAIALQARLVERELDGAVVTDALYDETGKLELIGRLHQTEAIDGALKDLLADEAPWTASTMKPHESKKDGQPIAWKDVVKATQAKLAGDKGGGERVRIDRLYYRYEKDQLRLVADGVLVAEAAKAIASAIDDVIATRGNATIAISELKK